ncbi:MAG: putative sulfate exporter family transporter, partial [Pseudomonadota bacterium]
SDGSSGATVPLFVIFFVVFVLVNSTGFVPSMLTEFMVDASRLLLVTAIAALGMKTKIGDMLALGGRHIFLVVSQTLLLLGAAVALVSVI